MNPSNLGARFPVPRPRELSKLKPTKSNSNPTRGPMAVFNLFNFAWLTVQRTEELRTHSFPEYYKLVLRTSVPQSTNSLKDPP
jgi:hypothetical protein